MVVWPDRGERRRSISRRFRSELTSISRSVDLRACARCSTFRLRARSGDARNRPGGYAPEAQAGEGRTRERLELWIDRETLLLVQMRMTFPGAIRRPSSWRTSPVNVPIAEGTFRIEP